jgi:protease secretion system outer membrane protein
VAKTLTLPKLLPLALASMLLGADASALTLMQAYDAALKNDPAYRAAFYVAEGGKENRILGRSNLLPNISGNYNINKNRNTLEYLGKEQPQDYTSRSATVQLRQPLINLDALARYKQGVAQSEQSEAQFASQSQEVILRVVSSYLEVLLKEDQLELSKAERDMYAEQMKVNDRLFKKGEGTRTDVLETRSRLDLAEAQVLEAEDALKTEKDTLEGVVGMEVVSLDHLRPGFQVANDDLRTFDEWKKTALEQNPDIQALTKGVEVARQEINKQRAGHAPRLDFIGTYGKTLSDTTSTIDEKTTVRAIGLQLTVPLYAGGAVSASTRQAAANREKARADLDAQTDKSLVELRRNYNLVASSVSRINALVKATESAKLLIAATEQSIKGGVRINLDLLTAQRQLYTAQRDLAQARYAYLLAALRLRAQAGILTSDDLRLVAARFE